MINTVQLPFSMTGVFGSTWHGFSLVSQNFFVLRKTYAQNEKSNIPYQHGVQEKTSLSFITGLSPSRRSPYFTF